MSFLLDPLFLIGIGVAIPFLAERGLNKVLRNPVHISSVITIILFWVISGLLYLDYLDVPWLGEAGSGRHFMWNSGVESIGLTPPIDVSITYTNPFCTLNLAAVLIFAIYPLFLCLGLYAGGRVLSK
jgi:hypothetical protein